MAIELLVPIAVMATLAVMVGLITRLFATISLNRTLREAMRSHPDSVPVLAEKLEARQPWADALLGWIFIALAVGIILLALFEDFEERRDMFQAAIVPALVGVTVLLFVRIAKRRND